MDNKTTANDFVLNLEQHKTRWGYLDTKFILNDNNNVEVTGKRYLVSGYEMPYFIPFIEEVLQVSFGKDFRPQAKLKIPPPILNDNFVKSAKRKFKTQIVFSDEDRFAHSHGQSTADEVNKVLYLGELERIADAVFYCYSEEKLEELIKLAIKHNVCLVPYGGGTSVSCSLLLPKDEKRMIVVVDMTTLSKLIEIDKINNRVKVEAGINGAYLEKKLQEQGFTLGHEPDSIEFSTVGGWIATNASGMKKNRYGNIEDIVENYVLITPKGKIELLYDHSRMSSGVSLHKAFFGSEGNFGFITRATLKIFKSPQIKRYESVVFENFEVGVNFLKDLQNEGEVPASIRLVDNLQFRLGRSLRGKEQRISRKITHALQGFVLTKIKKFEALKFVAATIVFEGSAEEVDAQHKIIARLLKKHNGIFGGSQNGQRGYMLTYAIAYIRDFMSDYYVLGETYETTVPWDKIHQVCKVVDEVTKKLHQQYKFPGICYVSSRITQLYQTGVCIYFTHGLCHKGVRDSEDKFAEIEKQIRKTIMDNGGSISHHHGIGKIRADFTNRLYTKDTKKILQLVKKQIDPKNIMGIQNNIFYKPKKRKK